MNKKGMIPLTDEGNKSFVKQKVCCICKKDLVLVMIIKSIFKSEIIITKKGNIEMLLLGFII